MLIDMPSIPWSELVNPILSLPDWSLKDACVLERDGLFHVFTSAFNEERSTVAYLTTSDFSAWSDFHWHLTGAEVGAVGICSPSVWADGDRVIVGLNTWGQPQPLLNGLYYLASHDLRTWSDLQPVAADLTAGHRCIDLALARHHGNWFATWKEGSAMRVAMAADLDGPWRFVIEGPVKPVRADGSVPREAGLTHENAQFIPIDGVWHLLVTDYEPHRPWWYCLDGDPADPAAWGRWVDGRELRVPSQRFNRVPRDHAAVLGGDFVRPLVDCWDDPGSVCLVDGLANAPFLLDRRAADGFFYLLYAGKNEVGRNGFNGAAAGGGQVGRDGWPRGWNRLALARSDDLVTWEPAGCRE